MPPWARFRLTGAMCVAARSMMQLWPAPGYFPVVRFPVVRQPAEGIFGLPGRRAVLQADRALVVLLADVTASSARTKRVPTSGKPGTVRRQRQGNPGGLVLIALLS